MSRGDNWIKMDKSLQSEFKRIRREFSEIEAMFSYTLDADKGHIGSISGYSKLWSWSRNRVRKFLQNITSKTGHKPDRKRTDTGHPIHFIDSDLERKPDRNRTETGQKPDTTYKTKTKSIIYTSNFVSFWEKYPRKVGKGKAFDAYKNIKEPKPTLKQILSALEQQTKSEQWSTKEFIPHPATWISQRRWEDETENDNPGLIHMPTQDEIEREQEERRRFYGLK